jgi:L-threonylcarbamoyladenylate synthase
LRCCGVVPDRYPAGAGRGAGGRRPALAAEATPGGEAPDLDPLLELLGIPWEPAWLEQAELSWPGAVTLVLPIQGEITQALHPGGTTLGLRIPACPQARELLRSSGPLATTSANRSGAEPARDAQEAARQFPDLPLLAPLPWPAGSGVASRVIAWEEGWRELRPGAGFASPSP